MHNTKAIELMTKDPVLVDPEATLAEAAGKMKTVGCGILPVGTKDKLQGIITDRDIVIRAIADGINPSQALVRQYMTERVITCNEDDVLKEAADKMRTHQVSRLIVKNRDGEITGILSFGGILRREADAEEVSNVVHHAIHKRLA